VVFNLRGDLAAESHEVVDDNPDDMKAVGDDACIWEPCSDEMPVRRAKVDADHADLFATLKPGNKRG